MTREIKLSQIAEAILDSAAKEHRVRNLEAPATVREYAGNAMDVEIDGHDATKIWTACRKIVELEEAGNVEGQTIYDRIMIELDEEETE